MEQKSILVKNIPGSFFNKKIIRQHFSKFGDITNLILNNRTNSCSLTFLSAIQAENARENGAVWNGKQVEIVWDENFRFEKDIEDELNWGIEDVVEETKEITKKSSPKIQFEVKYDQRRSPITEIRKTKMEETKEEENKGEIIKLEGDITGKIAQSYNDKLNILEERDKLIRMKKLNKIPNLNACVIVKGTCPDMCPEKERIMREIRGIVDPYEMMDDEGNLDHSRAVKEYTRSSADQEEPLPHELRPECVLTMTMEYLITQIMCKIENEDENLGNWFDFCWGRLRAIRKDIIQQQLCDLNTVNIVEQCARFHIICFDRLWGLPKSIFDEKINSETLMNCLQSLMHMYEDLKKQNVICPNEAEFRAFLILLKLKSGYLLSEYQQYSEDIQNSHEVKDAVNIHTAYSNNMYSTFFKLVKRTSYLNSCLMQRFFGHLRTSALEIIVRAHCPPNKMCRIPVQYIIECLKFDQTEDCINFCESFGFDLSDDSFYVSRNNFFFPETMYMVNTPSNLVIQKRVPVPEAVYGEKTLPKYFEHTVHTSFSEDNTLKEESLDASDQEEKMLRDNVERQLLKKRYVQEIDNIAQMQSHKENSSTVSNTLFKTSLKDNFYEDAEEMEDEEMKPEEEHMEIEGEEIFEDQVDNILEGRNEQIINDREESDTDSYVESERSSESSHMSFKSSSEQEINTDLIHASSFGSDTQQVFQSKSPPEQKQHPSFSHFIKPIQSPLVHKQISHSVFKKPLALPVPPTQNFSRKPHQFSLPNIKTPSPIKLSPKYQKTDPFKLTLKEKQENEENMILIKLKKKLSEKMKRTNARKYARLWRLKVEKIKKSRQDSKAGLLHMSLKDHLNIWGGSSNEMKPKMSERLDIRKRTGLLITAILHTDIVDKVDAAAKKVSGFVTDILGKNSVLFAHKYGNIAQPHPVYWKLVFALPETISGGSTFPTKLKMWCKTAFYPDANINLGEVYFKMSNTGVPIFISVHIIEGCKDIKKTCSNMSALVLVRAKGWETNAQTLDRLNKILNTVSGQIPVAVMTLGKRSDVFNLQIKKPNIIHLQQVTWDCTENLIKAIGVLAKNTYLYDLKVQSLGFLIEVTAEKFFDTLYEDKFSNEGLYELLTEPNSTIDFYNELLDKIEQEIEECCLFNLFGTACEFKSDITKNFSSYNLFPKHYNEPNFKNILTNCLRNLKLKHIKWEFKNSLDVLTVFKDYCQDLKCPYLLSKLMRLINPPDVDSGVDLSKFLKGISWLPIVELLTKQTLNSEHFNFNVVFRNDKIQEIVNSHWWLYSDVVLKLNKTLLTD